MSDSDEQIKICLNSIIEPARNNIFFTISNADGKTWIMPKHNMTIAMNLYQPSGTKGKLMKILFPYLLFLKPIRQKLNITTHYYDLYNELRNLLEKLFKTNNLEFAIFCGTPSVHQKITMQVSVEDKILGYCKFSNNPRIKEIFKYEESILELLQEKGLNNIPKCLYRGTIENDIDILVQTTTKTKHSNVVHEVTELHWNFLSGIYEKTKHKIDFINSDLHRILLSLLTIIDKFSEDDRQSITKAVQKINKHYEGHENDCCLYHGDFTPWNMFVERGNLFVFDWEYAQYSFPPYLDAFHFFTQEALFSRHLEPKDIVNQYRKEQNTTFSNVPDADITYLCYLLISIYHYWNRENGVFSGSVKRCIEAWIAIIKSLQNEENTFGIWNSPGSD